MTETTVDVTVEHCMTAAVLTAGPDEFLDRVAQAMIERNVGSIVVMEGREVRGILTERDILDAVARGLIPWTTKVSECMTQSPVTVEPSTTKMAAASVMTMRGFRHLPVVIDGELVGVVSLRDLV